MLLYKGFPAFRPENVDGLYEGRHCCSVPRAGWGSFWKPHFKWENFSVMHKTYDISVHCALRTEGSSRIVRPSRRR